MPEVAEVEALRPGEQLPRRGRLVQVEEEVVPSLQQKRRHRQGVELRARGAGCLRARDGRRQRFPAAAPARSGRGPGPSAATARPARGSRSARSSGRRPDRAQLQGSVHVIAGTIALKGTPATAAFQTSPPPSESPKAPIRGVRDVAAAGEPVEEVAARPAPPAARRAPNSPPEAPVPRASQASEANPASPARCRSAPCPRTTVRGRGRG